MPVFGGVEITHFTFIYASDTSVNTLNHFADGMMLRPDETLFILDPPMTFTWTENRPRPISVTSRYVRVAQRNLSNWNNQRIYEGSIHIIAKYDGNPTQASLNWIPASVIIPANQVSNETNPIITLTYDSATGRRSWVREVDELALDRYMFAQSISSGGVATYRESANFLFIHWSQPIQITHVPTSISSTGLISIPIPAVGAQVPNIDATGNAGNIIVRDVGIEVGTNFRAVFFDLTNNRLVAVEQGAPISAYNPKASWILICCVSPQDRSLAWIPGKINLPRPETNNSVSYVNSFGTVTWRIQSPLLPATISTSNAISEVHSTSIFLTLAKTNNTINIDSLELEKTLTTYMNRINGLQIAMPPKRFISSVVQFDDLAVLGNSGVQILNSKHITKLRDGTLKITFPVPVSSLNYGVLLSMNIKDKVGIIQYAEQAKDFVLVVSYDLQGKPTAFSGNFTIDIIV
jgi:hypothetical protein